MPVVCGLAISGCGSDKQKVVDQVNGICKDFNRESKPLFNDVRNLRDFGAKGRRAIPAIDRTGKRLASVKASKKVRKELGGGYTQFVSIFRQEAIAFGAAIAAADTGNKRQVEQLGSEIARLDERSDAQARKLGFDECAKG
jgi:outer membrane murein-binding lipoprotein Lpp